ncbi:hypothetical protein T492DRAFT_847487 [Pavlovales sp. CCMP2436]|nr:hypothetical protein T492DRAFT_847487 [Pavlovales sp. CCMP2436]
MFEPAMAGKGLPPPAFVAQTQMTLGNVISRPKLTAQLLVKPPFHFLHAVLCEVVRATGFGEGLYTPEELNAKLMLPELHTHTATPHRAPHPLQHRPLRMLFLAKFLALINAALGQQFALRVDKAVDGGDPCKTNEFLQLVAFASTAAHVASAVPALVPRAADDADLLVAEALAAELAEARAVATEAAEARVKACAARAPTDADGAEDVLRGSGGPRSRQAPDSQRTSAEAGRAAGARGDSAARPAAPAAARAGARAAAASGSRRPSGAAGSSRANVGGYSDSSSGASSAATREARAPPPLQANVARGRGGGAGLAAHGERAGPRADSEADDRPASWPGSGSESEWTEVEVAISEREQREREQREQAQAQAARRAPRAPPEPARPFRAHSLPAAQARTREAEAEVQEDGSWSCARCGTQNKAGLSYCNACATIRRNTGHLGSGSAPGPSAGRAPGAVHRSQSDSWYTPPASIAKAERGGSPARAGGGSGTRTDGGRADGGGPPPPGARRPSHAGAARCVEELFGEEDSQQQAGWYERKLHRQWSAHQGRERVREDADEVHRLREEAAEEHRRARSEAERGASAAARRGDAQRHEGCWARFAGAPPGEIRFVDVPWLPIEGEEVLREALGIAHATGDADARKKAHRAASMRWHPDRFSQQFGARLLAADYERIMGRVTATSQAINTMLR